MDIFDGMGSYWDGEGLKEYTGDYVDGVRNGTGVVFDKEYGIPCYEGEMKNGLKQGNGKGYDYKGTMVYEGVWEFNLKSVKGISYTEKGKPPLFAYKTFSRHQDLRR
jgi:hypothetical protein